MSFSVLSAKILVLLFNFVKLNKRLQMRAIQTKSFKSNQIKSKLQATLYSENFNWRLTKLEQENVQ